MRVNATIGWAEKGTIAGAIAGFILGGILGFIGFIILIISAIAHFVWKPESEKTS